VAPRVSARFCSCSQHSGSAGFQEVANVLQGCEWGQTKIMLFLSLTLSNGKRHMLRRRAKMQTKGHIYIRSFLTHKEYKQPQ
jgi:hypothetical protein